MSSPAPPRPPTLSETAAAWSGTRRVRVGAWDVRYREAGSGPPLVLVHGLGVSADYWFRNGPWLAAQGYRVLAPDLPGFGRTEGPDGGLSVEEQAAALMGWVEVMGLGPAVYVGHSISCQTAIQLAADAPALVRGLVLAAPTGERGRARQAWGLLRDAFREPPALFAPIVQAYLRAGPVRYWLTWRDTAAHDPLALLPRVHAPARVVIGTRDPVVSPEFAAQLAAGLGGRVVEIPGAAHAVIFEPSGRFNEAVREFVAGLPPV